MSKLQPSSGQTWRHKYQKGMCHRDFSQAIFGLQLHIADLKYDDPCTINHGNQMARHILAVTNAIAHTVRYQHRHYKKTGEPVDQQLVHTARECGTLITQFSKLRQTDANRHEAEIERLMKSANRYQNLSKILVSV